jgi:hypothetical protein
MKDCKKKVAYKTRDEAERDLQFSIEYTSRHSFGVPRRHLKRLIVYPHKCGFFHIGHRRKIQKDKTAPEPKPISRGDLRRKLERLARAWDRRKDHEARLRIVELSKIVADDLAWLKRYEEGQERAKDLEDNQRVARQMVAQLFQL